MAESARDIGTQLAHIAKTLQPRDGKDHDRWAHWQPAEVFMRNQRRRMAAAMLHRASVFPRPRDPCLEIGYGSLGWLGDLISWGMRCQDLHGMELDPRRAELAQAALPGADLRVGDATQLPWNDGHFRLVIVSTVFTSIPDSRQRSDLASEIIRVLAPDGAVLWYDFAVNNPANPYVQRVTRRDLRAIFPETAGEIRSLTLAPPLLRRVAAWSWGLATLLESIPPLRTHLMAVLKKSNSSYTNAHAQPPALGMADQDLSSARNKS